MAQTFNFNKVYTEVSVDAPTVYTSALSQISWNKVYVSVSVDAPQLSVPSHVFIHFNKVYTKASVDVPNIYISTLQHLQWNKAYIVIDVSRARLSTRESVYVPPSDEMSGKEPLLFANDKDKNLLILFDNGILKYPNRELDDEENETYALYEDAVSYYGKSSGRGIDTHLAINLAEIYSMIADTILYEIILDGEFESKSRNGYLMLKLFGDDKVKESDTPIWQGKVPYQAQGGTICVFLSEGLRVQKTLLDISIPTEVLSDIGKINISTISVGIVQRQRLGSN
jgi:hypothetical protein